MRIFFFSLICLVCSATPSFAKDLIFKFDHFTPPVYAGLLAKAGLPEKQIALNFPRQTQISPFEDRRIRAQKAREAVAYSNSLGDNTIFFSFTFLTSPGEYIFSRRVYRFCIPSIISLKNIGRVFVKYTLKKQIGISCTGERDTFEGHKIERGQKLDLPADETLGELLYNMQRDTGDSLAMTINCELPFIANHNIASGLDEIGCHGIYVALHPINKKAEFQLFNNTGYIWKMAKIKGGQWKYKFANSQN